MGQNNFTWIAPAGVFAVLVESWGAGAGGGFANAIFNGGGGGAAYSRTTSVPVIPGNSYNVATGIGGTTLQNGDDSIFNSLTPMAQRGFAPGFGTAGPGGKAAASVGDFKLDGADGGPPGSPTGGIGGDSGAPSAGRGGLGGAPGTGAGVGTDGTSPGGGGGGGGDASGAGGNGKDGGIVIWDNTAGLDWPGVTVNPPLASFGSPPPPPPPPFNPKARKSVSII